MIYNEVTKIEDFEKDVLDFLIYIEKETDILFDHSTLEGVFAWVTFDTGNSDRRTSCLPQEIYKITSTNYSIRFEIWYCCSPGCDKIVEVELVPTNSYFEEDLEEVTMYLEDITPDILISPFIPNFGYVDYS